MSTKEAAKVFYEEKEKCHGTYHSGGVKKNSRIKSCEIYHKLSKHLNIRQIYIYGKAYLIENHNQNVNNIVNRISAITKTTKQVNEQIEAAIGDIFQECIHYIDIKRDKDVLKGLFAKAMSASFVTKLQGVSNKL